MSDRLWELQCTGRSFALREVPDKKLDFGGCFADGKLRFQFPLQIANTYLDGFFGLGTKRPVRSCCESKGKEHCGLCSEFPCALLHQFAYDEKQGDDGKRIEQCKKWCAK